MYFPSSGLVRFWRNPNSLDSGELVSLEDRLVGKNSSSVFPNGYFPLPQLDGWEDSYLVSTVGTWSNSRKWNLQNYWYPLIISLGNFNHWNCPLWASSIQVFLPCLWFPGGFCSWFSALANCDSLYLSVSQSSGTAVSLWPHFSDRSKKSWFFTLFSFLLFRTVITSNLLTHQIRIQKSKMYF